MYNALDVFSHRKDVFTGTLPFGLLFRDIEAKLSRGERDWTGGERMEREGRLYMIFMRAGISCKDPCIQGSYLVKTYFKVS
jgi:hypothetical protein